jgi:hypothetical protein
MKITHIKSNKFLMSLLIIYILIIPACSNPEIPSDVMGTYTGTEHVQLRYDKDGQYIYKDKTVMMSMIINAKGNVTGTVGEAVFEGCKVARNRGWFSRQLNIKTDFIVNGKLKGGIFEKDSIPDKNISIPFNLKNGVLDGKLFLNNKGHNYAIISILKLSK